MKLLREYIAEILQENQPKFKKKLRVFDFDDTLVKTGSIIHVTNSSGEHFDLTPGEFAIYITQPGDAFDFSDFSKLVNPKEIKWTVQILRDIVASGCEVVILTARNSAAPVHEFLKQIKMSDLQVVALGDSNPLRKSAYIKDRIEADGLDMIEFFDDSYKNIAAVEDLQQIYPHVTIKVRHIVNKE